MELEVAEVHARSLTVTPQTVYSGICNTEVDTEIVFKAKLGAERSVGGVQAQLGFLFRAKGADVEIDSVPAFPTGFALFLRGERGGRKCGRKYYEREQT